MAKRKKVKVQRSPVAKALRLLPPKVIESKKLYSRKRKHK